MSLTALLLSALLTLGPAPATTPAEEALVSASITDMKAHLPARAVAFREVRLTTRPGTDFGLLCGQVSLQGPDGRGEWLPFASTRTESGYEHLLGGQTAGWCGPSLELDRSRDFAPRFETELVASR